MASLLRGLPGGVRADGVGRSRRIVDASQLHRRYIGDVGVDINLAPHRSASPMHRGCGANLRPHLQ
eukprot:7913784-Pyramimonas_sp.AAC.1